MEPRLLSRLDEFLHSNDMVVLYTSYTWQQDTYSSGFPDILRIERVLTKHAATTGVTVDDVREVAAWGRLRNPRRVGAANEVVLPKSALYSEDGAPSLALMSDPGEPVRVLWRAVRGIGPTYVSKVLRFSMPREFGAIDTRLVRVFGRGDARHQWHEWLSARVYQTGSGWAIDGSGWISHYITWVNVLRYLAANAPRECPHPDGFIREGLRTLGRWACADVEMALFTYASSITRSRARSGTCR